MFVCIDCLHLVDLKNGAGIDSFIRPMGVPCLICSVVLMLGVNE